LHLAASLLFFLELVCLGVPATVVKRLTIFQLESMDHTITCEPVLSFNGGLELNIWAILEERAIEISGHLSFEYFGRLELCFFQDRCEVAPHAERGE